MRNIIVIEMLADGSRRISSVNLIRPHILRHDTMRSDHCPIADGHPRHDRGFAADPDVIADGGITELFDREKGIEGVLGPRAPEHCEGISGWSDHRMVSARHQ